MKKILSKKRTDHKNPLNALWKSPNPERFELPCGQWSTMDAAAFLGHLRPQTADVIFIDPPFNLGKSYGSNGKEADLLNTLEYKAYMDLVLSRSIVLLKPGGALYLYHIPKWAIMFSGLLQQHLELRHWIAISMKSGFVRQKRLYPAHYALLYFTKGEPKHFNRPKLPISKCRHCGGSLKDYGGYKEFLKNGVNLSDFWDDVSPVRHKKYKTRTANELPIAITDRALYISGFAGGVVVDPFAGSGTSILSALKMQMQFLACDIDPTMKEVVTERLRDFLESPQ